VNVQAASCPERIRWQGMDLLLGEVLGSGSFSSVRAVAQTSSHLQGPSPMVAKLVEADHAGDEAELLTAMGPHPHLVRFFGCVHIDRRWHCLLLGRAFGGELFERVASMEHGLDERLAARWMHQLLQAVHHVHANGLVHRDIKPENILLATSAPDSPLLLADFGAAKRIQTPMGSHTPCGTRGYAAPEQVQLTQPSGSGFDGSPLRARYGRAADLWSCGVVAHVLLTGRMPTIGSLRKAASAAGTKEGAEESTSQPSLSLAHVLLTPSTADLVGIPLSSTAQTVQAAAAPHPSKPPTAAHVAQGSAEGSAQGSGISLEPFELTMPAESVSEVSSAGLHFVRSLLRQPGSRPTALQALAHGWLSGTWLAECHDERSWHSCSGGDDGRQVAHERAPELAKAPPVALTMAPTKAALAAAVSDARAPNQRLLDSPRRLGMLMRAPGPFCDGWKCTDRLSASSDSEGRSECGTASSSEAASPVGYDGGLNELRLPEAAMAGGSEHALGRPRGGLRSNYLAARTNYTVPLPPPNQPPPSTVFASGSNASSSSGSTPISTASSVSTAAASIKPSTSPMTDAASAVGTPTSQAPGFMLLDRRLDRALSVAEGLDQLATMRGASEGRVSPKSRKRKDSHDDSLPSACTSALQQLQQLQQQQEQQQLLRQSMGAPQRLAVPCGREANAEPPAETAVVADAQAPSAGLSNMKRARSINSGLMDLKF
jgi:serine/threonine protein kinase